MSDSQPTTIKTDPNYSGQKRGDTRGVTTGADYPSNDPSPHGQGDGSAANAPIDTKANLTPAASDKRADTYTTSVAPHGRLPRSTS